MTVRLIPASKLMRSLLCVVLLAGAALMVIAWRDTLGTPVVRYTQVELRGMAQDQAPVRIALISDLHVAGPDMPPSRLARIVTQVNALRPDVVLVAGDILGDRPIITQAYSPEEAIAPLGGLVAPLGVFAVPGNHDHHTGLPAIELAMQRHHVRMLVNQAVQAGPLVIGGLDDALYELADVPAVMHQMDALSGGRLMVTHSPDSFPLVPHRVSLAVAGHTHCGQITLPPGPWGHFAPVTMSRYGTRYICGRKVEEGKVLITTAGLGTSGIVPLRLFAPADIWLIEARPPKTTEAAGP